jgi:preprotein translocase subunit SecA
MSDEDFATYEAKIKQFGLDMVQQAERHLYLQVIDHYWIEHLNQMEQLRVGIGLRGYGQVDPLVEYKRESYGLFERLLGAIEAEVVQSLLRMEITQNQPQPQEEQKNLQFQGADESLAGGSIIPTSGNPEEAMEQVQEIAKEHEEQTAAESHPNIGRNDPCWCGSGKKFKKCHGA